MVRSSLSPPSDMTWVGLKPTSGTGGFVEAESEIAGTFTCTAPCNATSASLPYCVRMVRSGNLFSTSYSTDNGVTWIPFSSVTIVMPDPIYVGLFTNGDAPGNGPGCAPNNT